MRHDVRHKGAITPVAVKTERKDHITLKALIIEAQPILAVTRKGWRPRSEESHGNSRRVVESVFASLLECDVETFTVTDLSKVVKGHRRDGDPTRASNGQVSRAMSYLSTVLDWAAGRRRFDKEGAGRDPPLSTPDMLKMHDPSTDDPSITGLRERILTEAEIAAIWPLLQYPAPPILERDKIAPEDDYGPIAHKFILLTLARVDELTVLRWRDINRRTGVWTRMVKNTAGRGRMAKMSFGAVEEPRARLCGGR